MTAAALITLFVMLAIVMAALGGWRSHNRRRQITTHNDDEDDIFSRAPAWGGILNRKLNTLLAGQQRLHQQIGREARADERRDFQMSAETQAAIDELKAEVAPMSDAVTAVAATVDRLLAMVEEAGDDPEEIRAVVANIRAEREKIVAAALKGTPIEPSGN